MEMTRKQWIETVLHCSFTVLTHRRVAGTPDFCMCFMPIQFTLNYSYLLAYVGMSFRMFTLNFQQAITLRSHFFADGINTLKNSLVHDCSDQCSCLQPFSLLCCSDSKA